MDHDTLRFNVNLKISIIDRECLVCLIKVANVKTVSRKHENGENIDSNSNHKTLSKNTYVFSTNANHKLLKFAEIKLTVQHNQN